MKCKRCGIDIKEHPAGVCIDAWFCEDVMKWKLTNNVQYLLDRTNWSPSTNIAAAMEGEDKLIQLMDQLRYIRFLTQIINRDIGYELIEPVFDLVHATAHQRTRALIMWALQKGE